MKDETVCGALSPYSSIVMSPALVLTVAVQVAPWASDLGGALAYDFAVLVGDVEAVALAFAEGEDVAPVAELFESSGSSWVSSTTPPATSSTATTAPITCWLRRFFAARSASLA